MAAKPTRKAAPARAPGGKPSARKATKPDDSLLGWLGRQVGHVKKAVATDVTKLPQKKNPAPKAAHSKVIYRDDKIEQVQHPTQPGVVLRRTIIDEVIVEEESVRKGESSSQ